MPRFYCCEEWLEGNEESDFVEYSNDFNFCPYCGSKIRE